jgi:hypothetical protein
MLDPGRVIGRDETGRRVIAVAVDGWVLDWFTAPPEKRRPGVRCGAASGARACSADPALRTRP